MKKKINIQLIFFYATLVVLGAFIYIKTKYSGDNIKTDKQVIREIDRISKKYGKNNSKSTISIDDNNNKVINLSLYQTNLTLNKPIEIYAIFDVFLYLKQAQTDTKFSKISCSIERSPHIESSLYGKAIISMQEFLDIYSRINTDDKSKDGLAKSLSDIWITENFYNRNELTFEGDNKYLENLLTEWRVSIISNDSKYEASHVSGVSNFINICSVNYYNQNTGKSFSTSKQIGSIAFENIQLYAAWDNQNNLWVYGESKGIHTYVYNGKDKWVDQDNLDLEKMPYSLKKVVEYYSK